MVAPGQTLTQTKFFIVLRGDPQPRFANWSMDFDFAAGSSSASASTVSVPAASAEQETVFWQSIVSRTNPAMFEAYLAQFPNGVFRLLAEARLAELRERPKDPRPLGGPSIGSAVATAADARPPPTGSLIDFGDDSGSWPMDGDCDDPRFEGPGMSLPAGVAGERARDATDCRREHDEGRIRLYGVDLDSGLIDFGDDTGDSTRNDECNDPRFEGDIWSFTHPDDRGHDATDCRRLYDARRVHLFGVNIGRVR